MQGGIGPSNGIFLHQVEHGNAQRAIHHDIANQRDQQVERGEVRRDSFFNCEQSLDDPGLAAHLCQNPAARVGDIGQHKDPRHPFHPFGVFIGSACHE